VSVQESTSNKGGRPRKGEQERATVKLNCWVTTGESERIRSEYSKATAGKQLPFASYLKKKLLLERAVTTTKTNELLLTVLLNLKERGRQLEEIGKHLTQADGINSAELSRRITDELAAIQEMLTNLSQWLYES